MGTRLELHEKLLSLHENGNVYFQPPATIKMAYPAIVYTLSNAKLTRADNHAYLTCSRYTVTFIHSNPDVTYLDEMSSTFEMCSFDRRFISDNLYHDVYSIYY